jgi:hypothetical protein
MLHEEDAMRLTPPHAAATAVGRSLAGDYPGSLKEERSVTDDSRWLIAAKHARRARFTWRAPNGTVK